LDSRVFCDQPLKKRLTQRFASFAGMVHTREEPARAGVALGPSPEGDAAHAAPEPRRFPWYAHGRHTSPRPLPLWRTRLAPGGPASGRLPSHTDMHKCCRPLSPPASQAPGPLCCAARWSLAAPGPVCEGRRAHPAASSPSWAGSPARPSRGPMAL